MQVPHRPPEIGLVAGEEKASKVAWLKHQEPAACKLGPTGVVPTPVLRGRGAELGPVLEKAGSRCHEGLCLGVWFASLHHVAPPVEESPGP